MVWRKVFKALHEIGAVGVMGAFAICLVLVATAPDPQESLPGYAAVRSGIAAVSRYILVPSLLLVLCSGLLAMAVNPVLQDAGWAWLKALLGFAMFEGTLLTVDATARRAAELAQLAAGGGSWDPATLEALLRTERGGLWGLLALSVANVVIAVWRPRFRRAE